MQIYYSMPVLNCGKIYEVDLPNYLTKNNRPINLAKVKVDTRIIKMPCVLVNYSQNFEFEFLGFNPTLNIIYRLIRISNQTRYIRVLEHWNYRVSEVIPITVQGVNTIEPLVLNFCDCLANNCDDTFTYILQITEIVTKNTTFNILDQEISGIVSHGKSE